MGMFPWHRGFHSVAEAVPLGRSLGVGLLLMQFGCVTCQWRTAVLGVDRVDFPLFWFSFSLADFAFIFQ